MIKYIFLYNTNNLANNVMVPSHIKKHYIKVTEIT